jgi:hypothetical protein
LGFFSALGAAVAVAGLVAGDQSVIAESAYAGGLAAACISIGLVAWESQTRREILAEAQARANHVAMLAANAPNLVPDTALDDATAWCLAVLESAGDQEHAYLIRSAMGLEHELVAPRLEVTDYSDSASTRVAADPESELSR